MKINLAFIVGQLGLGGAEKQLYYFLSGLQVTQFRPLVICLGPCPDEYWELRIREIKIPVWHLSRSLGRAGRVRRIASLLRSEKIHLVHAWDFHTNPYSALAGWLAGVPSRIGSMRGEHRWVTTKPLVSALGYKGLDVLVINSSSAAEHVQKLGVTNALVRVVPNGVEIPGPLTEVQRQDLREELGFARGDRLIGTIGRMDHNKNHAMLLRVFSALSKDWPSLRLVIIGDGDLRRALSEMANTLGISDKVHFPGIIPTASRYMPAFEICCLTSYTEGMSNVIMEASAAGVPIVSTAYTGSRELVEHETTGYLVQPDDDFAMVTYLNDLLMNPRRGRELGIAGRKKIGRDYDLRSMGAAMTEVYEEALAKKGVI